MLSAHGEVVLEDPRPPADKIIEVADGYLVQNVTGIRVHIVSRLDGKGYDIAKRKLLSYMLENTVLRSAQWDHTP